MSPLTIKLLFGTGLLCYWLFEGFTERATWLGAQGTPPKPAKYHLQRLLEVLGIVLAVSFSYLLGRNYPDVSGLDFALLFLAYWTLGYTLYEAVFSLNYNTPLKGVTPFYYLDLIYSRLWLKPYPWKLLWWRFDHPPRTVFLGLFLMSLIIITLSFKEML